MADNFLERRLEQYNERSKHIVAPKNNNGVVWMIKKLFTSSVDVSYCLREDQLSAIASISDIIPLCDDSFLLSTLIGDRGELLSSSLGNGYKGYILISSKDEYGSCNRLLLGMLLQSMLMRASEMGLKGIICDVENLDREVVGSILPKNLQLVVAFGRAV